ncbi:hypothetical protein AAGQ96_09695 [Pantoea sp. MBD-2R]|uniref:hypothetical protein n=1 Tax=Pantoea sp. MBD-2R TaxID=3141540 RepID=UPI003182D71D
MSNQDDLLQGKNVKRWLISILTPTAILTGIAILFTWVFLYRLGRQDIFLQVVSFKDIFSFIAFSSVLSIFLFCLVFFTPSIISALILQGSPRNHSDYQKIKSNYVRILLWGSFLAVILFFAFCYFYPANKKPGAAWPVGLFFLANSVICILLNLWFNRHIAHKRSRYLSGWDWWEFVLTIHFFKPTMIGVASWLFVFPMGLLIKTLKFPDGTGNLKEALLLFGLTYFIVIITLVPLLVFIGLKSHIFKRLAIFSCAALMALALVSSLLPVIPAMIINLSMKLSGVMDLTVYRYAVPADKYPAEMFSGKNWSLTESKDTKFHIVEGVNLFSMGTVSLICPKTLPAVLTESMSYRLGDKDFDENLRDKLQQATRRCNIVDKETLLKWQE